MPKVHSHYENLKVARDASAEEIRAAYRSLTRQYHPDRNPDNADAARVMAVVNVAYGVLSDPKKRGQHDLWIAEEEAPRARPVHHATTLHRPSNRFENTGGRARRSPQARQVELDQRMRLLKVHLRRHRLTYGLGGAALAFAVVVGIASLLAPGLRSPVPDAAAYLQIAPGYVRPELAPNGRPWPARSGELDGLPHLNRGGASEVVIDNSGSNADMFAKLVALDGPSPVAVRNVYLAAHGRFTLTGLPIGTYDLRYRNLVSGTLARSPALILEDISTPRGVQHGKATVTLYQAATGNMLSYSLPEADF